MRLSERHRYEDMYGRHYKNADTENASTWKGKARFHDGEIVSAKYGWLHLGDSIQFLDVFRFHS